MEKFVIRGGTPLQGDVNIGGAKNAAVAILPATILAADKCLIENLPCISDVMASLQILSELGASIRMVSRSTYEIDTTHIDCTEVSNELSRQMRASYYFLGALLGRFGAGQVAVIEGIKELRPAPLRATDLRAGAAMVVAALAANGVSEIDETIHIERGYENIVEKLQQIGADIRRVEIPANSISRAM